MTTDQTKIRPSSTSSSASSPTTSPPRCHASTVVVGDKLGLYRAIARRDGPTDPAGLAAATGCDARLVEEWLKAQYVSGYCRDEDGQLLARRRAGRRARRSVDAGVHGRRHDHRGVDGQGRGQGPRSVPHRLRLRVERTTTTTSSTAPSASSSPATWPTSPPSGSPRSTARRPSSQAGARRRPRLRPRRVDHPAGRDLPEQHGHRLRLPRRVDRRRPHPRRGGGRGRPGDLRGRVGAGLPRHRLRPGVRVRRAPRHGRPARGGHPHPPVARHGGAFLLVEPMAGETVEDNVNPVGRIFYSASTFICTPVGAGPGGRLRPRGAGAGGDVARRHGPGRLRHLQAGHRDPVQPGVRGSTLNVGSVGSADQRRVSCSTRRWSARRGRPGSARCG